MRAWVFGEVQIEPALQRWFGAQQLTQEQEAEFQARVLDFLTSAEAASLRYTQHDPSPSGPAAVALEKAA